MPPPDGSLPRYLVTTGIAILALATSAFSVAFTWYTTYHQDPPSLTLTNQALDSNCKLEFTTSAGAGSQGKVGLCWSAVLINLGRGTANIIETTAFEFEKSEQV